MSANLGETPPSLLRNPDFLKLWTGQTVSVFGSEITNLAVPIVAALSLRVSPFEFGLLATLEFLPLVLLGLPAGVWVDRLRRRPILIVGDLGRAIALLSIPIAFALNALTIWQLYVVAFVTGSLSVFFDVAYQSYLPSIVERDQLVEGNAKLEITRTTSQRLGPAAAGVLISVFSAPFAVVIDAVSFVFSALFVGWIRHPEPPVAIRDATRPRPPMRNEIAVGLRYVTGHRWLRAIALTNAISNLFAYVADSILILYLVRERGFEATEIGFAFSIGSVGVIVAALITNRVTRIVGVGPMLVITSVGVGISWIPVAVAPDALLFPALTGTILALGFFGVGWNINQISLRQAVTPTRMRGRMNGTMRVISWSTIPLGTIAGGTLGSAIGLHETIWVGALGSVLGFLPVALSSVRHLREMPGSEDDDPPIADAEDDQSVRA